MTTTREYIARIERERDDARRWAKTWKRAAKWHKLDGIYSYEWWKPDFDELNKKFADALRWSAAWKRAAKHWLCLYRHLLTEPFSLSDAAFIVSVNCPESRSYRRARMTEDELNSALAGDWDVHP